MEIVVGIVFVLALFAWVMEGEPRRRYAQLGAWLNRRSAAFRRGVEHQRRIDSGTARKHADR